MKVGLNSMNKQNSVRFNMVINLLKTVFTTIFPLLIFKYISTILGKEGLGIVNFSNSIVQYFLVLAGLGVSAYATREGAKIREDNNKLEEIASEIFSINIISTLTAYVLLGLLLSVSNVLHEYIIIICIQSICIIATTLGVEWINIIVEDYIYITIRTILVQITSFLLIIMFVRKESDLIVYVIITCASNVVTSVINLLHSRKYIKLSFCISKHLLKHIKPIFVIFFMNIAISIYVTSDITMLGILGNETIVGDYSVASKIYSCMKTILAAVISVSIPRLSFYHEKSEKNYIELLQKIFSVFSFIGIPIVFGINLVTRFLIQMISSEQFFSCGKTVRILSFAIIPTMLSTIVNNNILLVQRKEKFILLSTLIAGSINVLLNYMLIPIYKGNAAAFTTVLSEIVVLVMSIGLAWQTVRKMNPNVLFSDAIKSLLGAVICYLVGIQIKHFMPDGLIRNIFLIIAFAISYFSIEYLLRNTVLISKFGRKQ